jgi:hypothetical protein
MKVKITHNEPDSDRALEIWLPSTAVPLYLRPGETAELNASYLRRITLGEGPKLAELDEGKSKVPAVEEYR